MKITAGLGSIDEYIPYVEAGASELFCGYVPAEWMDKYGMTSPFNRREVRYYNVQIGSESELMILRRMVDSYGAPVAITLNALNYQPQQYPEIAEYMLGLKRLGFDRFIIADHALLVYLHQQGISGQFHLHVSGELGEMNQGVLDECLDLGAERIICHRKMTPWEMKNVRKRGRCKKTNLFELEAFLMNEMCHFHGGFCNSLHCDEMPHMCLVPYRLGTLESERRDDAERSEATATIKASAGKHIEEFGKHISKSGTYISKPGSLQGEALSITDASYIPGSSGCGLCALPELQKAGVDWLKIVSRGAHVDETIADIRASKRALDILAETPDPEHFCRRLKVEIFPQGCSGQCYYQVPNNPYLYRQYMEQRGENSP